MNRTEWSLLLILSLLWGGSFLFNELALAGLPPVSIVLGRVAPGEGPTVFGIMPLAINVQIAGDCHGGSNLLFCGPSSVPVAADGERERGGYRTFFCRNCA